MANILLLYDTTEKDLARDFKDLLDELNVGSIIMIPSSPDKGLTLDAKEETYLKEAEGIIFILTPGSERLGTLYPSPSVAHEMGQAKQKFNTKPENIIYLADQKCKLPAIDQKSYILFERTNIRSVIESITLLIKNLKDAGLYRATPIPHHVPSSANNIDYLKLTKEIGVQIVKVLFDISNRPDGRIQDNELNQLLQEKYAMNTQKINFLKKDLEKHNLLIHNFLNFWSLNDNGWEVVRIEVERQKRERPQGLGLLSNFLPTYKSGLSNTPMTGLSGLRPQLHKNTSITCPNCSSDIKKIYLSPIPVDFVEIENATHECTKCGYKTKKI